MVENNDIGGQVPQILSREYDYENIIYTESSGRAGKKVSYGFGNKVEMGIRMSTMVKSIGCSMLKMLIEQYKIIINDADTISELSTFSKKGRSYEAETGKHDDLVMALVSFAWLTNQQFFKDISNNDILAALREKSKADMDTDLMPYGFIMDGSESDYDYDGLDRLEKLIL